MDEKDEEFEKRITAQPIIDQIYHDGSWESGGTGEILLRSVDERWARRKKDKWHSLTSLKGIMAFKNFLEGTHGEKYWELWIDIDKGRLINTEEEKQRYILHMRDKYYKKGSPFELSQEDKKLGLQNLSSCVSLVVFQRKSLEKIEASLVKLPMVTSKESEEHIDAENKMAALSSKIGIADKVPCPCCKPLDAILMESCNSWGNLASLKKPKDLLSPMMKIVDTHHKKSKIEAEKRITKIISLTVPRQPLYTFYRQDSQEASKVCLKPEDPIQDDVNYAEMTDCEFMGSERMEFLLQALHHEQDSLVLESTYRKVNERTSGRKFKNTENYFIRQARSSLNSQTGKVNICPVHWWRDASKGIGVSESIELTILDHLTPAYEDLFDEAEEYTPKVLFEAFQRYLNQDVVSFIGNGTWWRLGKVLEDKTSQQLNFGITEICQTATENKHLPLFLLSKGFQSRNIVEDVSEASDDMITTRKRRAQAVLKLLESRWISSIKEIFMFTQSLTKSFDLSAVSESLHHAHTDEVMLQQKVAAIINCFIDSSIPPSLQIDIPQDMERLQRIEMGLYSADDTDDRGEDDGEERADHTKFSYSAYLEEQEQWKRKLEEQFQMTGSWEDWVNYQHALGNYDLENMKLVTVADRIVFSVSGQPIEERPGFQDDPDVEPEAREYDIEDYIMYRNYLNIGLIILDDKKINFLDISDNPLGPEGMSSIAEMLSANRSIVELNISHTKPGREGLAELAKALRTNKTLRRLYLDSNTLDQADSKLLAELITEIPDLRELYLSNNSLGFKCGQHIAGALASDKGRLSVLDLQYNHIRTESAVQIALALARNTTLRSLNLAWNGLGTEGCRALASSLVHNTSLTELDLTCNRLGIKSLEFLLKGLSKNKGLTSIKIGNNPLTTQGVKALLKTILLAKDSELSHIDLEGIPIDDECLKLIEELKQSRNVQVIYDPVIHIATVDLTKDHDGTNLDRFDPVMVMFEYMKKDNLRVIDLFQFMDAKKREKLSRKDVRAGFNTLMIPFTEHAIDVIMEKVDTNRDGFITLEEMTKAYRENDRTVKLRRIRANKRKRKDQGLEDLWKILKDLIVKRKTVNDQRAAANQ
ncbi:hypothetical protein Btru_075215 [Bulinus truncatus]|nr:hypothetical protein Btru_075215 [Bulinus truncatus]